MQQGCVVWDLYSTNSMQQQESNNHIDRWLLAAAVACEMGVAARGTQLP
jgi:hypothetical protein